MKSRLSGKKGAQIPNNHAGRRKKERRVTEGDVLQKVLGKIFQGAVVLKRLGEDIVRIQGAKLGMIGAEDTEENLIALPPDNKGGNTGPVPEVLAVHQGKRLLLQSTAVDQKKLTAIKEVQTVRIEDRRKRVQPVTGEVYR